MLSAPPSSAPSAERIAVPASSLTVLPDGADLAAAAAFGVVYATAYNALRTTAALRTGERSSSSVRRAVWGSPPSISELARGAGHRRRVHEEKLAGVSHAGADATRRHEPRGAEDRVKGLTGGRGADVVLDPVGGALAERGDSRDRLARTLRRGRIRVGRDPRIPAEPPPAHRARSSALSILRAFLTNEPEEYRRNQAELLDLSPAGRIRPLVSARRTRSPTPPRLSTTSLRVAPSASWRSILGGERDVKRESIEIAEPRPSDLGGGGAAPRSARRPRHPLDAGGDRGVAPRGLIARPRHRARADRGAAAMSWEPRSSRSSGPSSTAARRPGWTSSTSTRRTAARRDRARPRPSGGASRRGRGVPARSTSRSRKVTRSEPTVRGVRLPAPPAALAGSPPLAGSGPTVFPSIRTERPRRSRARFLRSTTSRSA